MEGKARLRDTGERGGSAYTRRVLANLGHMVESLSAALAADKYIAFLLRKGPGCVSQAQIDDAVAKRNALMRETEY